MRLAGEIALVTGSTSGLGKEIARLFAVEGAAVAVTGRNAERGEALVGAIEAAGGRAHFFAADLAEHEACADLVQRVVARFGELSILVNNAVAGSTGGSGGAAPRDGTLTGTTPEAWERTLRINLTASAWLCRAAIPEMARRGAGAIVNVSSRAAERGTPGVAAYTASKGGMNALTRSIAIDYADQGIRCNSITPGYILHEVRDRDADPEVLERRRAQQLTRLATATDVAYAAVYLASREAEVITGIDLPVSGGSTTARALRFG